MAVERTLAIIKPDAMSRNLQGEIVKRIEAAGFKILARKSVRLSQERAEKFYGIHRHRPFFEELTAFMTSGDILVLVLEAEDAIQKWRDTMGATNPAEAAEGTIRRDLGTTIQNNCTHGSDGPVTAQAELAFFFDNNELS